METDVLDERLESGLLVEMELAGTELAGERLELVRVVETEVVDEKETVGTEVAVEAELHVGTEVVVDV